MEFSASKSEVSLNDVTSVEENKSQSKCFF